MKKKYVVKGNIVPLLRPRQFRGQMYDEYALNRDQWLLQLQEQHGDSRMFFGPLKLSASLELPYPHKISKRHVENLRGEYSTTFPSMGEVISLIGKFGTGILFNSDVIIVVATLEKTYGDEPCTYLTLSEV